MIIGLQEIIGDNPSPGRTHILELLRTLLQHHPEGIREYELLRKLKGHDIFIYAAGDLNDSLVLFRTHFLLFHLLYLLRQRLRQEGVWDLDIHCLSIQLRPAKKAEEGAVGESDPLSRYYLDLTHFFQVGQEAVDEMLEQFWHVFHGEKRRETALIRLGLPLAATPQEIKQRFRQLAMRHHPDHGGDATMFRDVMEAMEWLSP